MKRELALSFITVTLGGTPGCARPNPPPSMLEYPAAPDEPAPAGQVSAPPASEVSSETPEGDGSQSSRCPAHVVRGAACTAPESYTCQVPREVCGPEEWMCLDGEWTEIEYSCNPPMP